MLLRKPARLSPQKGYANKEAEHRKPHTQVLMTAKQAGQDQETGLGGEGLSFVLHDWALLQYYNLPLHLLTLVSSVRVGNNHGQSHTTSPHCCMEEPACATTPIVITVPLLFKSPGHHISQHLTFYLCFIPRKPR